MPAMWTSCSLLLIVLVTFCGCAVTKPAEPAASPFEVSTNPRILADYATPIEKMTLRGVALGSPRSAIRPNRILSEDPNGWIICRDACRYRVLNDKVVTLGAWDQQALGQLGVNDEADIEALFGKAEAVDRVDTVSTKMTIYRFANGQRRASWDRILNRLSTVNIGAAVATPKP